MDKRLSRKVNVLVDGFNFYYGCFRSDDPRCKAHSKLKWVNPRALAELIYPDDTVNRIHYCTARVGPGYNDPDQPVRQTIYLNALETVQGLQLHFGQYKKREKHGALVGPNTLINAYPIAGTYAIISANEEKGSDVNLATYLLESAFTKDCEIALVISNDSDLEGAVRIARVRAGIEVHILSPRDSVVRALKTASTRHSTLDSCALDSGGNYLDKTSLLRSCQFPPVVLTKQGVPITKPRSW